MKMSDQKIKNSLCLALDGFTTEESVLERVKELQGQIGLFKVGLELYCRFGLKIVEKIQALGGKVFLDLKLHDIPKTVEETSKVLSKLGVEIFNVHASGGETMMKAALEGSQGKSKVIGVTVLTSWDETRFKNELGHAEKIADYVLRLAKLTKSSGLHGVVCSSHELNLLRKNFPSDFILLTPGISGMTTPAGTDQSRVLSPLEAYKQGSTYMVLGRAINNLPTPELRKKEMDLIYKELRNVL